MRAAAASVVSLPSSALESPVPPPALSSRSGRPGTGAGNGQPGLSFAASCSARARLPARHIPAARLSCSLSCRPSSITAAIRARTTHSYAGTALALLLPSIRTASLTRRGRGRVSELGGTEREGGGEGDRERPALLMLPGERLSSLNTVRAAP